ncbi:MAG: RpiB/LacA/LacB family sugar-phosphate isomerase [Clostridia bacterium]|nr:RpiB/LacA/LacB family sugar-phosphate isomerase [Clostridia bacterium]
MRIGVIQASSQANKNALLYETVKKHAKGAEVHNFGCLPSEKQEYSYIEVSVLVGLLLSSRAVDFIVSGCSSGQGMMLACNSMPGVICGYAPTPMDAYLFAQINNGNALSLPLGEDYTWSGRENLDKTIEKLFSEPFAQGYPKGEADRKLRDTALLKRIRRRSQIDFVELMNSLEDAFIEKLMQKCDVIDFVLKYGSGETAEWLKARAGSDLC